MAYTTINKSTDYFNTKLYTGNGGNKCNNRCWISTRFYMDKTIEMKLEIMFYDAVRGATKNYIQMITGAKNYTATS